MITKVKRRLRRIILTIALWTPIRSLTQTLLSVDKTHSFITALESLGGFGFSAMLATERSPRGFVYASGGLGPQLFQSAIDGENVASSSDRSSGETSLEPDCQRWVTNWLIPAGEGRRLARRYSQSTIAITRFPNTTRQQRSYDNSHRIRYRYGLHFSVRGNVDRPKTIIITLANVHSAWEAVRYTVDEIAAVTNDRLQDTLIVAIQPRSTEAAMLHKQADVKFDRRIRKLIETLLNRYNLSDQSLIFYATASAAGRLANIFQFFHDSSAIFISPSNDFATSAIDNLSTNPGYTVEEAHRVTMPRESVGRRFGYHVLCTQHEYAYILETSNFMRLHSVTGFYIYNSERCHLGNNLISFAAVLLCSAISDSPPRRGEPVTELKKYVDSGSFGAQIRVEQAYPTASKPTWFLLTANNGNLLYWSLTNHQLPFVKYTNHDHLIDYKFDMVGSVLGAASFGFEQASTYHCLNLRIEE